MPEHSTGTIELETSNRKQSHWNNHTGKHCRNILPEQSRWQTMPKHFTGKNHAGNNHTGKHCRNILPEQSRWQTMLKHFTGKNHAGNNHTGKNHAGTITLEQSHWQAMP